MRAFCCPLHTVVACDGNICVPVKHRRVGCDRKPATGPSGYLLASSCGEKLSNILIDLLGKRFGRLVVTSRSSSSPDGRAKWNCICDCGAEKSVIGKDLRRGMTTSCGCYNKQKDVINLSGARFGRLVAREQIDNGLVRAHWLCVCDCGASKVVSSKNLIRGLTISCGCAVRDQLGLMPEDVRAKSAAATQKRRARKRGAGGSFTAAQVRALFAKQRGCCAWCGTSLKDGYHRDHRVPLARGGSNEISNIDLLCGPCNLSKGAMDPIAWANEMGKLC